MIMEQTEMKLHILLFLVLVIVTSQACYRPDVTSYFNEEDLYDYSAAWPCRGFQTGFPPASHLNDGFSRRPKLSGQGSEFSGRNYFGSHTKVPISKRPYGSRYLHGGKGSEVSPSLSIQGVQGRFLGNLPARYQNRVDGDRGSIAYDKSLVGRPGVRYSNTNKPGISSRLYDGSVPNYGDYFNFNRMNADIRPISYDGFSGKNFRYGGLVKRPSDWNNEHYEEYQPGRPYIDYATGEELNKRGVAFEKGVDEEYPIYDSISIGDLTDVLSNDDPRSQLAKIGFQTRFGVDSPGQSYYVVI